MTQVYPFVNGGWIKYPDRVSTRTFFRATDRFTKQVTVKAGQVLKKHSFVESIQGGADAGKVIAHKGLSESASVTFKALTSGQTLILGGLTFTAGSAGATPAQLATAWAGIADGTGYAALSAVTDGGTFTAGTLSGWNTFDFDKVDATSVDFRGSTYLSNVADLAATGTGTAPTISKVDGSASFAKVSGVTLYDVDASAGDVVVPVYTEASFYADALVWAVNPAIDYIVDSFGNQVACTAYNTGVYGPDVATTVRLQKQFVEQSEFEPLGFISVGETLGGTDYNV